MAKFILISAIVVLTAIIKEGSALKCWRCTSDLLTSSFCGDPFNPMLIKDDIQRKWAYIDCNVPFIPNAPPQKALCKKVKQIVDNREVVSRSCVFEDINTPSNQCSTDSLVAHVKTVFCQTCSTDGCNGAAMESITPAPNGAVMGSFIPGTIKIVILVNSFLFSLFIF